MKKIYLLAVFACFSNLILAQCDCSWQYKMPITITNAGATVLTSYQVSVNVNTAALVSAGKMLSTGNDIRFSKNNCTNFPYWIESGTMNSANTIIWIKVDSIAASGSTTINMFYGNSTAAAASNGDSTFLLFDDFNGTSVDATKWSQYNSGGSITVGSGTISFSSSNEVEIVSKSAFPPPYACEVKVNSSSGNWPDLGQADNGSRSGNVICTGGSTMYMGTANSGCAFWSTGLSSIGSVTGSGVWSFVRSTTNVASWPGGSTTSSAFSHPTTNQQSVVGSLCAGSSSMVVDWFRARQYSPSGTTQTPGAEAANVIPPITGTMILCAAATTTLSNAVGGGTWSSSNGGVATVGSTGIVTGVGPGQATITYNLATSCGSNVTATVTVNPVPSAISGANQACIGSTTALTDATGGGTWSSSNTSQATVVGSTGVVTGVAIGTPTISYTISTGCFVTLPITVNSSPAAIGGTAVVCPGTASTLTDATSGGTWSISSTAFATIGTSGVLTGVSGGNPTITYTGPTGCIATKVATVNPMSPITGELAVCATGTTAPLSDATPGGVWSSTNPAVATIGSASGVVTSVSAGVSTISYTIASTGCYALATFGVTGTPNVYTVGGGGNYCVGGSGTSITLSGSDFGVAYQLVTASGLVGAPVTGAGFMVTFPPVTPVATYSVVANYSSSCATTMSGTVNVSTNPLPTIFSVTGGGNYCSGGSGVHVGLSGSTIGVNYQLMKGTTMIGSPVSGTSAALDFGLITTPGTYTVVATNATTGCVNNMSGSVTVGTNPLPAPYTLTSSATSYCSGGSGITFGLSFSDAGVNYQLYYGGVAIAGTSVSGSGAAGIAFPGSQLSAGTYSVIATNATTGCSAAMGNTITTSVNALPTIFSASGGGAYCSGGTGVHVNLAGSTSGVNYQLFRGTTSVGSPVSGTGSMLDFGLFTTAGSYTIVATNATTGCVSNMFGSANVSINPLPTVFNVTGGGGYCAGGPGVHIGTSGSVAGVVYQLYNGATIIDAEPGTGSAIDYGYEPIAGSYYVVAVDGTTGCTNNMTGVVTVSVNPLPTVYTVNGGGNYCASGTGVHIGLSSSNTGISYQLFQGTTSSGTAVSGSGAGIDFGLRTSAGSYTAVATNTATGCVSNMSGSASVAINPLPLPFNVTGGGNFCNGSTGVHVGLSGTNTGFSYQLFKGIVPIGTAIPGSGSAIDFGLINVAGTYTVMSTNTTTACSVNMTGSAVLAALPLPTAYAVTGGGNYCAGTGGTHIGLGLSDTGVRYQLFVGSFPSGFAVTGTGSSIDFGARTFAGTYTVVATNIATSCTNNMLGSTTVSVVPRPSAFTVTGGGNMCPGGTGVNIGLAASTFGVNYQLFNASVATGPLVAGNGSAISFGPQTAAGTYTVVATDASTNCSTTMTGSASVIFNAAPTPYNLTGGGGYCIGMPGVNIGVSNSDTGNNYQLRLGGTAVGAPLPGTGSAINFGIQTATGVYDIVATNTTSGCSMSMTGSTLVSVEPLPATHLVTGGGNYCPGGTGVNIGLDISDAGYNYQLFNGSSPVTTLPGTGLVLDFGKQTALGSYTVVATNTITGCSVTMTGSTTVGLNTLPVVYNVTGGGNYCAGGAGVDVSLSGSDPGINYQLYNTSGAVGSAMPGTGITLDFGNQPAGTYTIIATNTATTCTNTMSGSALVGTNALPTTYIVTGGGNYCVGGTGVHVRLSSSDAGISYQLYAGTATSGSPVSGTGSALDFGLKTATGNYTVVGTNTTTGCVNNMVGSVSVGTRPLPTAFNVTGGGNYCVGTSGVNVGLSNSSVGVNYQLFKGAAGLTTMAGTGGSLSFGLQTATGTYTIVATDASAGCTTNMTGSAVVGISALPIAYTVSGGGNYCSGGSGVHIMLSGSNTGISYQLYINGITPVGPAITGTGFGLDFGAQTLPGIYSVQATNTTTSCVKNMTGNATVTVNSLPNIYSVSSTSSNYCIGGTGVVISLTGSDSGVDYQLYHAGTAVGSPAAGTGGIISFGSQTAAGLYTVVGVGSGTSCISNMASSVTVVINSLPAAFTVTGGGSYCTGGAGLHVGLSGTATGVSYQLYRDGATVGSAINGTGAGIDFGVQSTSGNYTVVATDPSTTCTNTMSGSAPIAVNALPNIYAVTGGGSYCAGGPGVIVGVGGSQVGVNYQLYNGSVASGAHVAGTGSSIDFGMTTTAGTYTVVATNAATGCTMNMLGSATVNVNTLPVAYPVTGGGNFCPGGLGVQVAVANSNTGITYQLFNGTTMVGTGMFGTGSTVDFGLQTTPGTYTVQATNATTGCTSIMTGSATVGLNPLPTLFTVTGGGGYCTGGAGVHVGVNGSTSGVNYQLFNGIVAVGGARGGTGAPIDLGIQSTPATYTVVATDATTGCVRTMAGSATVSITPVVNPAVSISTTAPDTICSGTFTTFTAVPVNGGATPSYQWKVNSTVMGASGTFAYTPADGDVVSLTMTSSAACAMPLSFTTTKTLNVLATGTPVVTVGVNPGNEVCEHTSVNFVATPSLGGSAPGYAWTVNGAPMTATGGGFNYTPANGDIVSVTMTSNYLCASTHTAVSTPITMTVDVPTTPVVQIAAIPGAHIAVDQTAIFTAVVTAGGGPAPSYQWEKNGIAIAGATSMTYTTNNLNNGDILTCTVVSSGGCAGLSGSGAITVSTYGVGVKNITLSGSDISLVPNPNKGTFTLKGTLGTSTDEDITVEVANMLGQIVYNGNITARNGELNEKISLSSDLANGMYILSLRSGTDSKVFHVAIEK